VHVARPIGEDERTEERRNPDHDEHVGEVERGPGVEIEKVRYPAQAHTVDQVRDAAAEDETQAHRQHRMAPARACEEPDHQADRESGDRDDGARSTGEETECNARVLHVVDREGTEELDTLADLDRAAYDLLRQLSATMAAAPTASNASHCPGPAASDRSADEIGRRAFAVDPTRTST